MENICKYLILAQAIPYKVEMLDFVKNNGGYEK